MPAKKRVQTPFDHPAPRGPSKFHIGLLLVVLAVAGVLVLKNAFTKQEGPTAPEPDDFAHLIVSVSRHILITSKEEPAIGTIVDADAMRQKDQTFFQNAQNGDRILLWPDQEVIYSPSRDLVVAVRPVSIPVATSTSQLPATAATTTDAIETATIEVRNGSGVTGLGKTWGDRMTAAGLAISGVHGAKAGATYPTTLLVHVGTTDEPKTQQTLETILGVTSTSALPMAETGVKSDFLVIIGKDLSK